MLFLFLSAIGCAQLELRRSKTEVGEGGKTPTVQSGGSRDDFQPPTMEALPVVEEKKVAVILGPGGYKTFAHVGVLKEFKKAGIPIHKIVGIEWGGLVAALFAQRGQVHEVEWKLYKFQRSELRGSSLFSLSSGPYDTKDFSNFLKTNLDKMDLSATAVPLELPTLSLKSGAVSWPQSGPLATVVRSALPAPPLFRANGDQMAALYSADEAVRRLTSEGFNVIILIDVLGDGPIFDKEDRKNDDATAALWTESRRELWALRSQVTDSVRVMTRGIHMADFDSRKVLMSAGETAGAKAAQEIVSKYGF